MSDPFSFPLQPDRWNDLDPTGDNLPDLPSSLPTNESGTTTHFISDSWKSKDPKRATWEPKGGAFPKRRRLTD